MSKVRTMKRTLFVFWMLLVCLAMLVCSCGKEPVKQEIVHQNMSEQEWRTAFAFENARVDCTMQSQTDDEPRVGEPIYGGTHYLFDGDLAAVANAKQQMVGNDGLIFYEKLFKEPRELMRLFDFTEHFLEFTALEESIYFCEKPSFKDVLWVGDYIEDAYVIFEDGKLRKIVYTYRIATDARPIIHTFAFSEYGQVELEVPKD